MFDMRAKSGCSDMRLTEFLTIDRLIFPSIHFPLSYYYVTRLVNIINQPANKINLKSCFMQIMSEVSCSYHSHTSIFAEYPNHKILQKFQTKVNLCDSAYLANKSFKQMGSRGRLETLQSLIPAYFTEKPSLGQFAKFPAPAAPNNYWESVC